MGVRKEMEREHATKFIYDLLRNLLSRKGSDLFLSAGFPPAMKIDGKMTPVSQQALTAQHTRELARSIMNDKQAAEFEATQGVQLRHRPGRHRPLSRERVCAAGAVSAWCCA